MIIVRPKILKFLSDDNVIRAIAIFPFIILATESDRNCLWLINHESIHLRQQIELLIIPFYIWYFLENIIRQIIYKDKVKAYRNISFEKEANYNEHNLSYLKKRKLFSFIKYY